jgi:hypothetical protein
MQAAKLALPENLPITFATPAPPDSCQLKLRRPTPAPFIKKIVLRGGFLD